MRKKIKAIVILIFFVVGLSGCALVAFTGGVGAGYAVGKDRRSLGQMVDDASLTASIKAKLIKDPEVKAFQVNVDTEEGNVTLSGKVKSRSVRRQAVKLARSVEGVKKVTSKLKIIP